MAKIQLKRSDVTEGGVAKRPTAAIMDDGELAVNYSNLDPTMFIKDSAGDIVGFKPTFDADININAGTGLVASGENATSNQSVDTTRILAIDTSWLNTTINTEIGKGDININPGNGLQATGSNANANQKSNTTRTLSVKNADNSIVVNSSGIKVNNSVLGKVPTAIEADKAKSLSTTRSLWGQAFNGTANVTGTLMGATEVIGSNAEMRIQPGGTNNNLRLESRGDGYMRYEGDYHYFIGHNGSGSYAFARTTNVAISGQLNFENLSTNRSYTYPNKSGTIALTSDLPTIPAVGNGRITIKQPGVSDQSFTVNQSGATTINLKNDNTTYNVGNGKITIKQNGIADQTFTVNQGGNTTITLRNDNTTYNVNNGQINVNASTGLNVTGANATANQSGNTTRTLSVNTTWLDQRIQNNAYTKAQTDGRYLRIDAAAGAQTIASTSRLTVQGEIVSAKDITAFSDKRLKDNIEEISDALEKVKAIRGVTYSRIDHGDTCKRHAGVIAQEVEKVLPEVISESDCGYKTVAYGPLVGLLIEAVKELSDEVRRLKEGGY